MGGNEEEVMGEEEEVEKEDGEEEEAGRKTEVIFVEIRRLSVSCLSLSPSAYSFQETHFHWTDHRLDQN